MKAPKPSIPKGAPPGTVWYGGPIEWFSMRLTIQSENLVPAEVTRLLDCKPDESWQKGKPVLRSDGTVMRIPKHGAWHIQLKPGETDEWNCAEAMMLLMARVPKTVTVWRQITKKHSAAFFVGLLMPSKNKGFQLPPAIMKHLGDRGIAAGFDIYYEDETSDKRVI